MTMRSWIPISVLISVAIVSCAETLSPDTIELDASTRFIDLAALVEGTWDLVCVVGPYSTQKRIRDISGVPTAPILKSNIYQSDSIALLVFVGGNSIQRFVELPRQHADFTALHGECFKRPEARFRIPQQGWPHVEVLVQ